MLLSEIWGRIVFRWKTVCAVVVLAIVGAVAFGVFSGTDYSAKTVLTVNPLTTNPFSSATANQQINITTERAILSSSEVARRAVADLGDETSAASLSENARIEAPQGSQILTVTVVDTDPQLAADKANALAAAYLEFRAEGAAQVADTYIKAIDERIESLSKSETNGSTFDLALADLVNQRNDLALVAENPGRIIGYADEAETSSNSSLVLYAAAGLTGGLILGLIAAVLRDRLSKVVGNADLFGPGNGPGRGHYAQRVGSRRNPLGSQVTNASGEYRGTVSQIHRGASTGQDPGSQATRAPVGILASPPAAQSQHVPGCYSCRSTGWRMARFD